MNEPSHDPPAGGTHTKMIIWNNTGKKLVVR